MSVTLKELASRLNLSDTTVSDALSARSSVRVSAATRKRVREEATRLGYQPNVNARRLLQNRVEGLTPVFVSEIPAYATYLLERAHHLQNRLAALGYDAPLIIGRGGAPEATRKQVMSLCGQRPAGIVWMAITWFGKELQPIFEQYALSGGELVCLDWQQDETRPCGAGVVQFDRKHNSCVVTKHLIDLGHRSLGVFLGPDAGRTNAVPPRTEGVLQACEEDPETAAQVRLRWFETAHFPGPQAGVAIAEQFLALAPAERPTGVVLLNDRTAMAFIARVQRAGIRVPHDVSVVGHDDEEMSAFFPVPLTTVSHPHHALAEAAADLLNRRLTDRKEDLSPVTAVRGELRVRASAAPPPSPPPVT
jgi:DNA-binding LacI/PurR family transcriptional regulator